MQVLLAACLYAQKNVNKGYQRCRPWYCLETLCLTVQKGYPAVYVSRRNHHKEVNSFWKNVFLHSSCYNKFANLRHHRILPWFYSGKFWSNILHFFAVQFYACSLRSKFHCNQWGLFPGECYSYQTLHELQNELYRETLYVWVVVIILCRCY